MTILNLLDHLVLKHFGQHPERGRRMKLRTIKAYAGMKPPAFGKNGEWKPNPVTVDAVVSLKYVSKNMWDVQVDPLFRESTEWWLIDTCGPLAVKAKKPRVRRTPSRFKPNQMAIKER